MPNDLPLGQLVPQAKPVSTFLQFQAAQPGAPARPTEMPTPKGVNMIQRGGSQNIQGYNSLEQLSQALTPVMKAVDSGMQLYASDQYKRGQNEVLKAYSLADRQQQQGALDYAADNRAVSRADSVAGLMMDQVNPFRQGGRINQASRLAAQEAPKVMNLALRANAELLRKLDPADPRVDQIRGLAVSNLAGKWGLDQYSSGFMDYVIPAINQSWERFGQEHLDLRNKHLKATQSTLLANGLYSGLIAIPASQTDITATLQTMGAEVQRNGLELGIAGEPTEMKREAFKRTVEMLRMAAKNPATATQARRALGIITQIPMGEADPSGRQMTAGEFFGVDLLESDAKISQTIRTQRDAEVKSLGEQFADKYLGELDGVPDGPQKLEILQRAENDPAFQAIPRMERRNLLMQADKSNEEFATQGSPVGAIEGFLEDQSARFGSAFNEAAARRDFNALNAQVPAAAGQQRAENRARFEALVARKRSEAGNFDGGIVNSSVTNATKEALAQSYPDITEGALRGLNNAEAVLAYGDQYRKAATARFVAEAKQRVYAALEGAKAAKGTSTLTAGEQQQITTKTLSDMQKDEALMRRLMPPLPGKGIAPAAGGSKPAGGGGGAQSSTPVQTFSPGSLNSVPEARLKKWQSEPLLNGQDTSRLMNDVRDGKTLPAPFRRAAARAGTTPEQLLIRQAELNFGEVNPQLKKKILTQGNRAQGYQEASQPVAAIPAAMQQFSGGLANMLMGITPASAASRSDFPGETPRAYGSGRPQQAVVDTANKLGISPVVLASVIAMETGGTFNKDIVGGQGGNHRGLIQFGPSEQKTYGYRPGMTFEEQVMGPVYRYLKARGVRAGHGPAEVYAAILTGNVANIQRGGLDWKDSFGTSVRGALPRLNPGGGHYNNAIRFLQQR